VDPGAGRAVFVEARREDRGYPVFVEVGGLRSLPDRLRDRVPAHRYAVISDATVGELYGKGVEGALVEAGLEARLFSFPAGEAKKTRETWAALTDALLEWGLGRDGAVVAMGGGVTGDLGGFVGSTYMRGLPVVQVPTSLVAMVDASIGGKTGVDVPGGKNLVGAFHPPEFVLADPTVLETLPRGERAQGLAEAVKHGAILDRGYLEELEARAGLLLDGDPEALEGAVRRSVELKARVVSRDERESGRRQILNFGHTLGHAVEAASGYRLPHGSAVAIGMVWEGRLGETVGATEEGTARRLARVLEALELPVAIPGAMDPEGLVSRTEVDKKGRRGVPRYVLLARPGEVARSGHAWTHPVPREEVLALLRGATDAGIGRDRTS